MSVHEQIRGDVGAIKDVVPYIVAAAARGLEWARVEPWPDATRDDRGLAITR